MGDDAVLEVEVKYRTPDRAALLARLEGVAVVRLGPRTEEDHYFNAPDRDLRQTDEAFRLRRVGPRNVLTYKGPKRGTATKTRAEIEVPLADGDGPARDAERMLLALGYKSVAVVRKRREVFRFTRGGFAVEACLDDVEDVGAFAEIEVLAEEADFERAQAVVLATAAELGLTDVERRSYLGLLLGS